jgi:hypothetical protein
MNLFHNDDFVMSNPFEFNDRFDGSEGFFSSTGRLWVKENSVATWETNFVEDTTTIELPPLHNRGGGGRSLGLELASNTLAAHVSEFEVGRYKKAHRHGPGAHVVFLKGEGYSLLWKTDFTEHTKVPWHRNSVLVPPSYWWHQHFNTGSDPARYLALRWGGRKHPLNHSYDGTTIDRRQGGDQIEYEDQDPAVDRYFLESCRGSSTLMGERT